MYIASKMRGERKRLTCRPLVSQMRVPRTCNEKPAATFAVQLHSAVELPESARSHNNCFVAIVSMVVDSINTYIPTMPTDTCTDAERIITSIVLH